MPRKKEPELPFPTEGDVFWTWFVVMLVLLPLIWYWCSP